MPLQSSVRAATLRAALALKMNPRAVQSALGKRPTNRPPLPTRERLKVAALQMSLNLVDEVGTWVEQCERLTRVAAERGAQLVVFPEYVSLPLLGLAPRVREAVNQSASFAQVVALPETRALLPLSQRAYETLGAELATRYGVYVMLGSTITTDSAGGLYNTAFLFDPEGRRAGTWDKLSPSPHETDWLTRGDDVRVLTLAFTQIAVLVGADAQSWEAARIATLRGAEILVCASGAPAATDPGSAGRGMASRAQESRAFGVHASAIVSMCGLFWGGPSAIIAPLGLRQTPSAFLARTRTPNVEEVIAADLDLAGLRELRDAHPFDWNIELYRKHLTRAYEP